MKKNLFITAFLLLLFVSCNDSVTKITVTNTLNFDRKSEMVEISTGNLPADFGTKTYILKNGMGEEIGYQIAGSGSVFIFQADVPADSFAVYTLTEGTPAPVAQKTDAFYVPERKDDFAWENNLAAYRMYGPALADEYPSNGVDLWLKNTAEPVMRRFYDNEHNNGKSYHIDHGEGLDCYKVAHTLGAGGIAPFADGKLYVGGHYSSYQIVEKGALRSVFTLVYDSIKTEHTSYKATLTVTVDAGSLLNKAAVRYEGAESDPLKLAAGIYLHDTAAVKGIIYSSDAHNMVAYAEDATSDAGVPAGRNYVGVITKEKSTAWQEITDSVDKHFVRIADYNPGDEFLYYFGGGWNKWGFPADSDWFKAMERFNETLNSPLEITVE